MEKIIVLQFACTVAGDEAEAKLARQLPRVVGRKLQASGVVAVEFLSLRDTVEGTVYFVNSTDMPDTAALREIAAEQGARYVVFGRTGAGERITIDARLYDAEKDAVVFRKFVETYAGYTVDALDEIAWRALQHTEHREVDEERRVALFRRETASWEAFLYYLMAEDDRYGLEIGVVPPDLSLPVAAYIEALRIDPSMHDAERGLVRLLIEALERNLLSPEKVLETLSTVVDEFADMESAAQAFVYILLALERPVEAADEAMRSAQAMPWSPVLQKALADALAAQGRTAEAAESFAAWVEEHSSSDAWTLLAEWFAERDTLPGAAERAQAAERQAEECRRREQMQALPVVGDCSLN